MIIIIIIIMMIIVMMENYNLGSGRVGWGCVYLEGTKGVPRKRV